jgi:hypothetical protein
VTVPDRDYSTQRVILGTHTSENEQNHLIIAGEGAVELVVRVASGAAYTTAVFGSVACRWLCD